MISIRKIHTTCVWAYCLHGLHVFQVAQSIRAHVEQVLGQHGGSGDSSVHLFTQPPPLYTPPGGSGCSPAGPKPAARSARRTAGQLLMHTKSF